MAKTSMTILDFWGNRINAAGSGDHLAKVFARNEWEKSEARRLGALSKKHLKDLWKMEEVAKNERKEFDGEAVHN